MNADIETQEDFNTLQIREFLSRAPVIKMSIGIRTGFNLLTGEKLTDEKPDVDVSNEMITEYHPDDPVVELPISHGIVVSGPEQGRLSPELLKAIREYLIEEFGQMVDQPMNEPTLKQPITTLTGFFDAFKKLGYLNDYHVYFDLERSSHRYSSIAYHIDIHPIDTTFFKEHGITLWLQYTKLLRPEIVDIANTWLPWLMERLHLFTSQ